MSKTSQTSDGKIMFWCPGCEDCHWINDTWQSFGLPDNPSFNPSVLVIYRHPKGYTNEKPAPLGYNGEYVEDRCHSFVRDGQIEFLTDSYHKLAGQTVPLPDREWAPA